MTPRRDEFDLKQRAKIRLWQEMGRHGQRRIRGDRLGKFYSITVVKILIFILAQDPRRAEFERRIIEEEFSLIDTPRWQATRQRW